MYFERAGDSYWEKKSKAAGLRATANHLHDLNPEDVHEILRQAAEIFEGIGIINIVAQCLSDLGDHEKAGINLKSCARKAACALALLCTQDEEVHLNRELGNARNDLVDEDPGFDPVSFFLIQVVITSIDTLCKVIYVGEMGTVITFGARESCEFFHDRMKGK
ncbi:hypothetical protein S83_051488, partial [Arachis hypogaea]